MPWDIASARACAVGHQVLLDSTVPVLGTAAHAMTSPLPYGVGVYSVDASGSKKDLPLYYVSPKVAAARGDKVKAGWYVAATPGQGFELRLTAVQTDFPKVRGAKLQKGYDVDALVIVDGTRASKRQLKTFGREKTIAGFTESESQEKGKTIRKFKFSKVTTSEGEGDSGLRGSGAIVVIMCSGKCVPQEGKDWKLDLGAGNSTVEEKEAVKAGKSISVSRDGEKVTKTFTSSGFKIISPKKEGSFTSFLRERFWLQSRRIIHADGTPWGPVKDVPIIDLCTKADPTDGPPQKKIKREDGMPKIVEASATSFS